MSGCSTGISGKMHCVRAAGLGMVLRFVVEQERDLVGSDKHSAVARCS